MHSPHLIPFTCDVLAQANVVIEKLALHQSQNPSAPQFESYIGPHLRHILEHYEALVCALNNPEDNTVYYDRRERDRTVEKSASAMHLRYTKLIADIRRLQADQLMQPLTLLLQAGLGGEHEIACVSNLARELMFLASHAVHHYALVQVYCLQHSISLGKDFGKAPSTVYYERTH